MFVTKTKNFIKKFFVRPKFQNGSLVNYHEKQYVIAESEYSLSYGTYFYVLDGIENFKFQESLLEA